MVKIFSLRDFPEGFFEADPKAILKSLDNFSFIDSNNGSDKYLMISCLLHGDEPSGFHAALKKLSELQKGFSYGFNLLFFFGNVEAARESNFEKRFLDHQEDFNRIWATDKAKDALNYIFSKNIAANIDLHNTSGDNPMYCIAYSNDNKTVELANVISPILIFSEINTGTMDLILSRKFPSIVVECGQGSKEGSNKNAERCLDSFLDYFEGKEVVIYEEPTVITDYKKVFVKPDVDFGFNGNSFTIRKDIEALNFNVLPQNGHVGGFSGEDMPLSVISNGKDTASKYFDVVGGKVVAKKDLLVSMATSKVDNIKKDCLFYISEIN